MISRVARYGLLWIFAASCIASQATAVDPLPSWNDGATKQRIVAFVKAVTDRGSKGFAPSVRDWIATAKHPKTGRRYTEMIYQPMLELLATCAPGTRPRRRAGP
jgi:hypothetical protein